MNLNTTVTLKVKDREGNVIAYHARCTCIDEVVKYLQSLRYVSYYGDDPMPVNSGLKRFGPGYISEEEL